MAQNHPDKLEHLDPVFRELAHKRTVAIQAATFERIQRARSGAAHVKRGTP